MTRVTAWVGLAVGIGVAVFVAPWVVAGIEQSADPQLRALVTVGVFLLLASLGATIGEVVGVSLRRLIPPGPARQFDHAGGGVAGGLGALVLVWLLLPALAEVPGEIASQVRNSVVAQAVDEATPSVPEPLRALRNLVQDADFPQVFEGLRPAPRDAGPPPEASGLPAAVVERVAASTVQVSGSACGRVLEGSGFSPEPGVVVTNAHVVAGVTRPTVQTPAGRRLRAVVTVFDPNRDLAVLEVDGLRQDPLPIAQAEVGDTGAVFGHPGGQAALEVSPARVVQRVSALGRNIYGTQVVRRDVFVLAAELRPGDSGGALVGTDGSVVGVAFAIAPDEPNVAYALTSTELREVLDLPRETGTGTGPCIR